MTENDTLDVEAGLNRLGLVLPAPMKLGEGMRLPFPWVRMRGNRIYVSGHGPQNPDGTLAHPLGKVGKDVTPDQGYEAARLTALAVLGSLRRELGDLNRVTAWLRVHGMVNVAPPPASTGPPRSSTASQISWSKPLESGGVTPAPPWAWPRCPGAWP